MVIEFDMRKNIAHNAKAAAATLATLTRSESGDRTPQRPDVKIKILTLARRVAAVREEMEKRTQAAASDR